VNCPGTIIEDSTISNLSPHLTGYDEVDWVLDDADGFKQYLNDTSGVNLDDLITGTFYVSRLSMSPVLNIYTKLTKLRPAESCLLVPINQGGLNQNVSSTEAKRVVCTRDSDEDSDDSDPYDPPENCRTLW
jgi:hypothetical protein